MPSDALLMRHAFQRAAGRPHFVAGRWLALGSTETPESLAEALGCTQDPETAVKVGLCRAPMQGEDLDAWAAEVAQYAGVHAGRVRQVAERIAVR